MTSRKQKTSKNINSKGRVIYDKSQYLTLTYNMLKSPQFRFLNGSDLKVLLEIASRHNGFNNGRICAGLQDLADTLMMSKSTVQRALDNLQKTKFLICPKKGKFMGRLASEWEVSFLPVEGMKAKNEWGYTKALVCKRKPKSKSLMDETLQDIKQSKI